MNQVLRRATQQLRSLLEEECREQLVERFDIREEGRIAPEGPASLSEGERLLRANLVTVIRREHEGKKDTDKVVAFVREAAFTILNRFVALKMLEARGLVQECVSRGEESAGFREFVLLAPGLTELGDNGYRLYVESLFDEVAREVRVLFDRLAFTGLLWPRSRAFDRILELLNEPELADGWSEDETIGWVYQYFNSDEERRGIRDEARSGPRNSRELAILNQFFTPRYVVRFLVENTLARIWWAMRRGQTGLAGGCRLLAIRPGREPEPRAPKDPRDLKILDPAVGSGHFLLYAFDLLLTIYDEAWDDPEVPASSVTNDRLREAYPTRELLYGAAPTLILRHNLFGVDIDARCAQIASLALWLRAQRAYKDRGISPERRIPVTRTNIVVAEPMPEDAGLLSDFLDGLARELRGVVSDVFQHMRLAGDAGTLLRIEKDIEGTLKEHLGEEGELFGDLGSTGWRAIEAKVHDALRSYADHGASEVFARQLFADDAARGFAFIDLCGSRYDVVLMNPPFGKTSVESKDYIVRTWPRTKNDLYAAFVERGLDLLVPGGMLGALTSRTGFFLSSFRRWREEILLEEARPVVVADLGYGVLDDAMVEVAAYCLEAR